MQQQIIDLISKLNKVSIETTQELININARAFEKFAKKRVDSLNDSIEISMTQLEAVGKIKEAKDIPNYVNAQIDNMQICTEKFYASAKESMEMLVETTDEVNTWMKKGMDAAAFSLKSSPSKKKAA